MSTYKLEDFKRGDRVQYVPIHAFGDRTHPDCRRGTVSSVNHHCVFVRYDEQVARLGWDGTTSQGTLPGDLEKE